MLCKITVKLEKNHNQSYLCSFDWLFNKYCLLAFQKYCYRDIVMPSLSPYLELNIKTRIGHSAAEI